MSAIRTTIMLDADLAKKIRIKQAKKITSSDANYSFSQAINDTLRDAL